MTKGAIFDMDGTLVDTERLYRLGWLYAAEAIGEIPHPDFPAAMCSVGGEIAERNVRKFYPNHSHSELKVHCIKRFLELLQTELELMPGVKEMLTYLKAQGYNEAKMSPSSTACCKWGKHTLTSGEHISRFVETLIGRKL